MSVKKRGFASMSKDRLKKVCAKGGKNAQRNGNGHQWDTAEATLAGRKGLLVRDARRSGTKPPDDSSDTPD